jgi:capsular exopolysaccharide synthesis family protein
MLDSPDPRTDYERGSNGGNGMSPPGSPSPEDPAVPWHFYWSVVTGRKQVVLGTLAIVVLVVIIYTFRVTPLYRSTSRLLIEREGPKLLDVQEIFQVGEGWQNEYYQTQCKLLESPRIAERVFKRLDLWKDPTFRDTADPINAFLAHLRVQPVRNSRLVDIYVEHPDPAKAAAWANAVVTEYIADTKERRRQVGLDAQVQLKREEAEKRAEVDALEQAIQDFKEAHGLLSVNKRQTLLERKLEELSTQATDAGKERQDLEVAQERLAALLKEGAWDALFALPQAQGNLMLFKMREEQIKILQERQELMKTYREKHPKLLAVQSRLEIVDQTLRAEAERVAAGIRVSYEQALAKETKAKETLDAAKTEKVQFDRDLIKLGKLQRKAEAAKSLFQSILKRVQETSVSAQFELTNISVVEQAKIPKKPFSPNKALNLALGIAAGLALGLATAFLVEQLDPTIDSPGEAERMVGSALLGVIPHVSANGRRKETAKPGAPVALEEAVNGNGSFVDLICHTDAKSHASEAFRAVRTAIHFAERGTAVRRLVVVSMAPFEGKTTAVINLGITMAQAGHRVLIVDGDMRRPRLHRCFHLAEAERGLSDVLTGQASMEKVVQPTPVERLSILPSGTIPTNPSELLCSPRMDEFLLEASERYDRVIFDSPPVGAVTDACVLAPSLDGVVHVIGHGLTSRHAVRHGRDQLVAFGARYIGAIYNNAPLRCRRYGYSGYWYGGYDERYSGYYGYEKGKNT